MRPSAKLAAAIALTTAGAGAAALGATTRWFTVEQQRRTVDVPGFGTVPFGGATFGADGGDISAGVPGLAVLLLLAALLLFLASPRARFLLLPGVMAGAALLIVLSAGASGAEARDTACRVQTALRCDSRDLPVAVRPGPGRTITIAGAALAALGAAAALPFAGRVGKLRMPEGAPSAGS